MKDYLVKATAYNGNVRVYTAVTTESVGEGCSRQDTWATASAALGRTMTITTMMGAMLKGEDKLTVKVEGNGPLGVIVADANAHGKIRGYVGNSHVDFDLNRQGKLDVARAVGTEGNVSVVKDLGMRDHFTGQVPIVSGEISEDLTYYFAHSEQTPSAVGAGVLVNPDLTVLAAGGFIVQLMPEADEEVVTRLEEQIQAFPSISKLIEEGNSAEQILFHLFSENDVTIHEHLPIEFQCNCSRERVKRAIVGLGNEEIEKMIREDKGAEANCHFCEEAYEFTEEDLLNLLQQ